MTSRITIVFLLTVCLCGILPAASPTIGVAMANGNFQLDRSSVVGNANVFEGSVIETGRVLSDLTLTNGLKMRLGAESRGQVFRDRLVLEKGAGEVSGSNYFVTAGRLRVTPVGSNATARVAFAAKNTVEIAAIGGAVHVVTADGISLANIAPNTALSFTDQAGAATPTTLCGKVRRENGKLMLTDTTSNVTVELTGGTNLDQYVGKSISVTGNLSGTSGLQVLNARQDSCGVPGGAAAGAGGLSHAQVAGIVIGGAAAGILGGLAGAGAFSGGPASQ